MTEKRKNFQEAAMRYGTVMGIFWTLKFVLFPLGMQSPLLLMAFFLLTLIVPIVGFFLVRQYRDRECEGVLTFSRAFLFTSFMYLFAALFVTIAHYIYFRYMDNGLIISTYQDMLNQMSGIATADMKASIEQFQLALDIGNLHSIDYTECFLLHPHRSSYGFAGAETEKRINHGHISSYTFI